MSELGEIKKGNKTRVRQIWCACVDCGRERWARMYGGKPRQRCHSCSTKASGIGGSGSGHPLWKGGRRITSAGYVEVWISPDGFFYPMAKSNSCVMEHRLVMAKHLNRCLLPWEVVHHKGTKYPLGSKENKGDNRIENLELIKGKGKHNTRYDQELKRQGEEIGSLQQRVTLLEAENILLKEQIKESDRCGWQELENWRD